MKKKYFYDRVMIGERVKQLRNKTGERQDKVADGLGIDKSLLSRYENGKSRIPEDQLCSIANYFDVPIDYFFLGKEEVKKRDEVIDILETSIRNAVNDFKKEMFKF